MITLSVIVYVPKENLIFRTVFLNMKLNSQAYEIRKLLD
jgi:hypothetical protein